MMKYTDSDILQALSHIEWKRFMVIREDIMAAKGVDRYSISNDVNFSWLYWKLEVFVKNGFVSERNGIDPEILAQRQGHPYTEYILTEDGLRIRQNQSENQKMPAIGTKLAPQEL